MTYSELTAHARDLQAAVYSKQAEVYEIEGQLCSMIGDEKGREHFEGLVNSYYENAEAYRLMAARERNAA